MTKTQIKTSLFSFIQYLPGEPYTKGYPK